LDQNGVFDLLVLLRLVSLLLLLSHCDLVCSGEIIRSSVSQELENGLHAKYLNYISTKMDMSLEITPIPLARRIQELRKGNLDLMVGIRRDSEEEDEFIYVLPSYEKLRHTFLYERMTRISSTISSNC
jgi:polar amino acid transport system substrate-binding protein